MCVKIKENSFSYQWVKEDRAESLNGRKIYKHPHRKRFAQARSHVAHQRYAYENEKANVKRTNENEKKVIIASSYAYM